jgi:hypothetical protein
LKKEKETAKPKGSGESTSLEKLLEEGFYVMTWLENYKGLEPETLKIVSIHQLK